MFSLSDLQVLTPIIAKLGGQEAIVKLFHAIQDVGRWVAVELHGLHIIRDLLKTTRIAHKNRILMFFLPL